MHDPVDGDYEAWIAGLLRRAYDGDLSHDPRAADRYVEARAVLEQGDHYLSVMIDLAFDRRTKPWWAFWR